MKSEGVSVTTWALKPKYSCFTSYSLHFQATVSVSRCSLKCVIICQGLPLIFKILILHHLLFAWMQVSKTCKAHWSFGKRKAAEKRWWDKKDKWMTRIRKLNEMKSVFKDKEVWQGQKWEMCQKKKKWWGWRGERRKWGMKQTIWSKKKDPLCFLNVLLNHGRLLLPSVNVCLCVRTCNIMLWIGFCCINTEQDRNYNSQQR